MFKAKQAKKWEEAEALAEKTLQRGQKRGKKAMKISGAGVKKLAKLKQLRITN